jgi:COMPASS component SWD3
MDGPSGLLRDGHSNEYIRGFKAHPQGESNFHRLDKSAYGTGINDLAISPDSLYLVTASDSLVAHLHQLRPPPGTTPSLSTQPLPLQVYEGHTAAILSIAFSPTSNMLVSGSMDESAIIWDVKSGSSMRQLPAHSEAVWCVGWDAGGGICITSSADGLM